MLPPDSRRDVQRRADGVDVGDGVGVGKSLDLIQSQTNHLYQKSEKVSV